MNTGQLLQIARDAGDAILEYYRQPVEVTDKADASPVTAADYAAHEVIIAGLKKLTPDIPVISEESELPEYDERRRWNRFWIVDPLDGTKEFIKQLDEFTVNIALIENGKPVMGVVYAPAIDTIYFGSVNEGSWKLADGNKQRIHSRLASKSDPLVVAVSRSHGTDEQEEFLSKLNVKERISAGSSLKFCLVAEGRADVYPRFGPTMEWDVAAGDAVFRYSAEEGEHPSPLTYNKKDLRNASFVIGLLQ